MTFAPIEDITNIVSTLIAVAGFGTAWYYRRLEHRHHIEEVIDSNRKAGLFLSREAMMKYLVKMYDRAEEGDVIWAQCVRCADFTPDVREKILKAAGRGVSFEMLINVHSPALEEFQALFAPIKQARVTAVADVKLSVQGLSNKEVVLALPEMEAYTAVVIRNKHVVEIFRNWFNARNAGA